MKSRALPQFAAIAAAILSTAASSEAQEVSGVEHWVEREGIKLYVWEKYVGSPAGKGLIVLARILPRGPMAVMPDLIVPLLPVRCVTGSKEPWVVLGCRCSWSGFGT
jgi:hypothetical protein